MIDVQHVEQLALVFVDALDLDVEQACRVDRDAGRALRCSSARRSLLRMLDGGELGVGSRRRRRRRAQLLQLIEVVPPAAADALGRAARPEPGWPAPASAAA